MTNLSSIWLVLLVVTGNYNGPQFHLSSAFSTFIPSNHRRLNSFRPFVGKIKHFARETEVSNIKSAENGRRSNKNANYNRRNENNKLNQRIRNCKSVQELIDLLQQQEYEGKSQPFHTSFYWNQVKFLMKNNSECQELRNNPTIIKPLVEQTFDFGAELTHPRALSIMSHSIAKISSRIRKPVIQSKKLWRLLEDNIVECAADPKTARLLNSQCCANIFWSFAKANRRKSSEALFETLLDHILLNNNLDEFNSQELANTVWAYATLGHYSFSPELFDAISEMTIEKLDTYNSQAMVNTVWAYATVRHSSPKLFDAVSETAIQKLNTFNSQDIANTVWAYATLGYSSPRLFDAISDVAIHNLHTFKSQEIANTVWAYATLGHSSPKLLDAMSEMALEKLQTFNSQEIANTVWAYATLGHSSPKLFDAMLEMTMEKLDTFNAQEIANTMWAYGTARHEIEASVLKELVIQREFVR